MACNVGGNQIACKRCSDEESWPDLNLPLERAEKEPDMPQRWAKETFLWIPWSPGQPGSSLNAQASNVAREFEKLRKFAYCLDRLTWRPENAKMSKQHENDAIIIPRAT